VLCTYGLSPTVAWAAPQALRRKLLVESVRAHHFFALLPVSVGGHQMKILRFHLILWILLLLTACDDPAESPTEIPVPERISAVGTQSFGRYPGSSDVETLIFNEKFLTDDDVLQIHIAPVSRVVYCIDLIIPQVPGDGDA
jgi:hypothetical protein